MKASSEGDSYVFELKKIQPCCGLDPVPFPNTLQ